MMMMIVIISDLKNALSGRKRTVQNPHLTHLPTAFLKQIRHLYLLFLLYPLS